MIKSILSLVKFDTPLGVMTAGAVVEGLCLLEFDNPQRIAKECEELNRYLKAEINELDLPGGSAHLCQIQVELEAYFSGTLQDFTVPLCYPGTDFQHLVWRGLQDIPYGETRSYTQQAEALGRVRSVRAVASANGRNRLSIVIPCHRVIGANGTIRGYGGGLDRKRFLLALEAQLH